MSTGYEEQAAHVVPPRRSFTLALAVDATARAYDLSALQMAHYTPEADLKRRSEVFWTLQAESAAIYFQFSNVNQANLDDTAKISAGGTLTYANTYGAILPSGQTADLHIDRSLDKYLVVKTATGTATLRMWASSHSSG